MFARLGLLLLLPFLMLRATEDRPLFSEQEKAWIKAHPVIKVGSGDDWAPFNYVDNDGTFKGITKDYLDLIEEKSGLKIELTVGKWNDVLQQFKAGKLDLLPAALYNKERTKFGDYLPAHIKLRDFIYTRADNTEINSFKDLNGKTLARIRGYAVLDPYLPHLKNVKIVEVGSTLELINAVHNKRADAFLEGQANINHILKENMIGGFKSIAQSVSKPTTAHMLVRKNAPILYAVLKKSLQSITTAERDAIYRRWVYLGNEARSALKLTAEQQEWIDSHPRIVVGGESDWAPFDFVDDSGHYKGLANDYLNLIAKKSGLHFEITTGKSWSELLDAVKTHEVDLLPALYYTPERERDLVTFSDSYLTLSEYYFTRKEHPAIGHIEELYGKRVAVIKGFEVADWLKAQHPQIERVVTANLLEALYALSSGKADAFIGDNPSTGYTINKHFISDIKINGLVHERMAPKLHMGVRKDWAPLAEILSAAIDTISDEEHRAIERKWTGYLEALSERIRLTAKERDWIEKHPLLRVVADPDWAPFEYIDKETGELSGISRSYLDLISKKTGLKFEVVPIESWPEGVDKMKHREADLFSCVNTTASREAYLNFTIPYLTFPVVIIATQEKPYMTGLAALNGKSVAFVRGHAVTETVLRDHPKIVPHFTETLTEALHSVAKGEAYAFVSMQEVASYNINKEHLFNLKISGKTEYDFPLHMALRNDWDPTGIDIINKALRSISDQERDDIYNRWISVTYEEQINYTLLLQISGVFALFLLVSFYWNRRLSNAKQLIEEHTFALDEQKLFLNTLLDSQDQIVVTTDGDYIQSVNRRFLEFYGIESLSDFPYRCICDTFDEDPEKGYLQTLMDEERWVDYVIARPDLIHKAAITVDGQQHIFTVTAADLPLTDIISKSAVFTDITELEEQKRQLQLILDNLPQPMVITRDKAILFANPEAVSAFEITSNSHLHSDTVEQLLYESPKVRNAIMNELKRRGFVKNVELQFTRPQDAEKADILLSLIQISYEGDPSILATFIDITEQKRREAEIKKLHRHVTDSIDYAALIQHAIMPDQSLLEKYFSDHFAIWQPKDTIGGDIFLMDELGSDNEMLLMVIDCTGHGVAGAFVTMLVKAIERQIVANSYKDASVSPAKILSIFNGSIKHLLKQEESSSVSNVGFDGAVIYYNKERREVIYAGAQIPIFYITPENGNGVQMIKGDRHSVGYKSSQSDYSFTDHIITAPPGTKFYLTTDGFLDQNGGDKGFPFGKKRFVSLVESIHTLPFGIQKERFIEALRAYTRGSERNDDITFVGIEV